MSPLVRRSISNGTERGLGTNITFHVFKPNRQSDSLSYNGCFLSLIPLNSLAQPRSLCFLYSVSVTGLQACDCGAVLVTPLQRLQLRSHLVKLHNDTVRLVGNMGGKSRVRMWNVDSGAAADPSPQGFVLSFFVFASFKDAEQLERWFPLFF